MAISFNQAHKEFNFYKKRIHFLFNLVPFKAQSLRILIDTLID